MAFLYIKENCGIKEEIMHSEDRENAHRLFSRFLTKLQQFVKTPAEALTLLCELAEEEAEKIEITHRRTFKKEEKKEKEKLDYLTSPKMPSRFKPKKEVVGERQYNGT
jgi:predicted nucleotide-binding protein (sugar kinase/HSP70/actin superfamily)